MKRALLVAGGTVAGVAAVLSYTPPELTAAASSGGLAPLGATDSSPNQSATTDQGSASAGTTSSPTQAPANSSEPAPTQAPTQTPTKAAAPAQKPAQTSTPTQTETPAPAQTPTQTPTQTPAPTATKKSSSGTKTVTGKAYNAGGFGSVQVKITITDGVVTAAEALQYPNQDRRSSWISQQAIPWLVEQTLAAKNSANLDGVGGATFTTYAWISSLKSALQQAGI